MANYDNPNTDPENLVTGLSSAEAQVETFGNETKPKSVQAEIDKQKEVGAYLTGPLVEEIQAYIAGERAKLKDVHGYLDMIKSAPAKEKEKIFDEFRSRELSLAFIEGFEQWMISKVRTHQANQ